MNRDFVEMLAALCAAGAEFLVVGAHAVAAHGVPRATGALDIWIRPSPQNAERVLAALKAFGAPLLDLTGVDFDQAWQGRLESKIEGIQVDFIGRSELISNKRATGRPKDLADVVALELGEDHD